ncbi:hypothetical protein C7455_104373 [Roseicyclus mahoneyensis]|uniref:Uncharacterized protein n=1 Tax=Roseicyclus mahoneyensis TaxID=164332 RepID=A0A316GJF3_9RHOB|nr:hypothetical protein C7455_104373 [Roseicyclus mahoneyensis]
MLARPPTLRFDFKICDLARPKESLPASNHLKGSTLNIYPHRTTSGVVVEFLVQCECIYLVLNEFLRPELSRAAHHSNFMTIFADRNLECRFSIAVEYCVILINHTRFLRLRDVLFEHFWMRFESMHCCRG